jgi:DNA-directed RNA polymerase specialized sigma24 family protein
VSTRKPIATPASHQPAPSPASDRETSRQLQELGLIAGSRRDLLLRVHRFRLRPEDLEDCYGQAVLELSVQVRAGHRFASAAHAANVLEQRFLSRINDRRRALAGRSPIQAALEQAWSLGPVEPDFAVVDLRADPHAQLVLREHLSSVGAAARLLSRDQRLVLTSQLEGVAPADFRVLHGWSAEKYRKVAQRARARLRRLTAEPEGAVPSRAPGSEQQPGTRR